MSILMSDAPETTTTPLPITTAPGLWSGKPAWLPGSGGTRVRTTVGAGNNDVRLKLSNNAKNANNIANVGGGGRGGGGGGGGGGGLDPTTALLLAQLMAQQNAAAPAPAVPPGPIFMGPNPYAMPPGYLNPNTVAPTASETAAPVVDPTTALLQQLMMNTPAPAPPPTVPVWAWVAGGVCCLSLIGSVVFMLVRKKGSNR